MNKEELLKKWTLEVLECEITKGKFKRILEVNEFVKSKSLYYDFTDEEDKEEVCLWIKKDLKALEKVLKMIDKGEANRYTFYDFERLFLW